MALTVNDLIKSSLRVCGVVGKSEAPDADEMQDALLACNMMLNAWSVKSLMVLGAILQPFTLVPGTSEYTIGTGQTFDTPVPTSIDYAFVRDPSGPDYNVEVIKDDEFQSITDKTDTSGTPQKMSLYRGLTQQALPSGTIRLWPIPDRSYTLYLGTQSPLTELVNLDDTVIFQGAYQEAIKYNLALRLWREYYDEGKPVPADILGMATASIHTLEMMNHRSPKAMIDLARGNGGRYNPYTDQVS